MVRKVRLQYAALAPGIGATTQRGKAIELKRTGQRRSQAQIKARPYAYRDNLSRSAQA